MSRPGTPAIVAVFALITVIWGTTWAAIRIGLEGIPPFTGVAIRFGIAAAVVLPLAWAKRIPLGRTRLEWRLWMVNAGLSFIISYGVVYWAEQWVPSGLAAVLFATYPLFVAILAHFFLSGERLRPLGALATLVGFGGVAVIYSEDFTRLGGPQVALASVIFLISPIVSAIASIAVKQWGKGVHPISLTGVPMGMAAIVMGILAFATERNHPMVFDVKSVGALLYLAVFGSAVTFIGYFWLLARVPATRASLIAYMFPVIAVVTGVMFLDEPMTARILAGSGLVIAGVALAVHSHARPARRVEPPAPE